jgi:hypothetical protein
MAAKMNDEKVMKDIFYAGGIDTSQEFKIREVLHRPCTSNEPWFGLRVEGLERLDQEWRHSGSCSLEAYLYSEDQSLTDELNSLDPWKSKNRSLYEEEEFEDEFLSSDELDVRGGE